MPEISADLDSSFNAEITNDTITINIEVSKIPSQITELMRDRMDEISDAMLRALFATVSGTEVKNLRSKTRRYTSVTAPTTPTRN